MPFGTFKVPNISSHPQYGIGAWSEADFINAIMHGVGRNGEHLYPAFPYTSYQRMALADVRDLFAYLKTLASVEGIGKPMVPVQSLILSAFDIATGDVSVNP